MKNTLYIIGFCLTCIYSYGIHAIEKAIVVDNDIRALVAPEGAQYQWSHDGKIIREGVNRILEINKSGNYQVQVIEKNGAVTSKDINVTIDANGIIYKIYTIGDSTVQDYNDGYYPRKGWGQVLSYFFNTANVQVINKGAGGTSSKSFYNNNWPSIRNSLQAGDYVFIQFGINDRNKADAARYAPTGGEFENYLTRFVDETRAKGAFPVLITTIRRNAWNADNKTVYDAYHDHPVAVRTVAKNLNVPLIDLDAKAKKAMESAGMTYSTWFWYNNYQPGEYANYRNGNKDDVHFQEMGAIEMAKLITEGVKELSSDENVGKLSENIATQYPLSVTSSVFNGGIITQSSTYPAGLTITLKAIPDTIKNHFFTSWTDNNFREVSKNKIYSFTMPAAQTSFVANFDGLTSVSYDNSGEIISYYPNPFSDFINIEIDNNFNYSIVDGYGHEVESGSQENKSSVGKKLESGFYILKVVKDKINYHFKICKN